MSESYVEDEIELKLSTTQEGYEKALSVLKTEEEHLQLTRYFDTGDYHLFEKYITLRMRTENSRDVSTITLKKKKNLSSNISEAVELHRNIQTSEIESFLARNYALHDFFEMEKLRAYGMDEIPGGIHFVGQIENTRTFLSGIDGYTVHLDKTSYSAGVVSYQIEIENIAVDMDQGLVDSLIQLGIPVSRDANGKYTTFIKLLKGTGRSHKNAG